MNISEGQKVALSNGVHSLTFSELVSSATSLAYRMAGSRKKRFHLIGGNDIRLFPYLYAAGESGKDLIVMPDFIPRIAIEMTKFTLGAGKSVEKLGSSQASELPGGGNVIVFTSGTTGRPKPVALSPHVLEVDNSELMSQIGFRPELDVFTPAPMLAAPTAYAMYLSSGATVNTLPYVSGNPTEVVRGFNVSGAMVLACTPSVLEKIIDGPGLQAMPDLIKIHLTTSPVSKSLVNKIRDNNVSVIDLYISSETGPVGWREVNEDDNFTIFDGVNIEETNGPLEISDPFSYHAKGWYSKSGVIPMTYPMTNGDSLILNKRKISSIYRENGRVKVAGFAVSPLTLLDEVMRIDGVIDARVEVVRGEPSDSLILYVDSSLSEHDIRRLLSDRLPWYYVPRRIEHVI